MTARVDISDRPAMRTPLHRSPLLRATMAFGIALVLATAPRFVLSEHDGWTIFACYGLAAMASTAGVLVLIQSAAIRKIQDLRAGSKEQLDDLARWALYAEQITEALAEVQHLRDKSRSADPWPLVDRLLRSAATRASVALDPSVRFYVVESTVSSHVVRARAGTEPFAVDVGKSCPADRSLEEVACGLARFHEIVPVVLRGGQLSLVLLADRRPSRADCTFVRQLGLAISLSGNRVEQKNTHRAPGHLRAV